VFMVTALATGARITSFSALESDVGSGKVDAVRLVGVAPPGHTLQGVVRVRWRAGLVPREAEVFSARSRVAARSAAQQSGDVVTGDVGAHLSRLHPGLTVTRAPWPSSNFTLWGWRLPGWMGLATLVLGLAPLGLVGNGPEPWRATRWAWFWLLASPFGLLGFLLLSGPTPGLPAPRANRRRLHGGWAFLVSAVLRSLVIAHR